MASNSVYIGLGGNVGDVIASMRSVLTLFEQHEKVSVTSVSPVYKTPPWGVEDQDWFLNACAELETDLEPKALLDLALTFEKDLKRERVLRWGPRTIDIDILVYGDLVMDEEDLTIPHPRMHERLFVMKPLSDIASQLMIKGKSTSDWLKAFDGETLEEVTPMPDWWRKTS